VPILAGLCFLCSNRAGPGHIRHLDYGRVTLAEFDPDGRARGVTGAMTRIEHDLGQAGIPVLLADDLQAARWRKLVWNMPFNGLSVILRASTSELMENEHTRALAEAVMHEVQAGARACGKDIDDLFVARMLEDTVRMTPYRTSMIIDYDERRPMEVEAIYGNPLRTGEAAGARLPLIGALYRQLKFLDAHNLAPAEKTP
jgi:2-dehydropantoate 2-reductase